MLAESTRKTMGSLHGAAFLCFRPSRKKGKFPREVKVCNLRIIKIYYENKFFVDADIQRRGDYTMCC